MSLREVVVRAIIRMAGEALGVCRCHRIPKWAADDPSYRVPANLSPGDRCMCMCRFHQAVEEDLKR